MNRSDFMKALPVAALLGALWPKGRENVEATHLGRPLVPVEDVKVGYLDRMRLHPDGTLTTVGNDVYTGERATITYTMHVTADGARVRVPHPEGARAVYHG